MNREEELTRLINLEEPAWPLVQSWIQDATNPVRVLPASEPARSDALLKTQITTRSPMGTIVYETGGLLIDHGWVRVLGSGHSDLPRSLPDWNEGRSIKDGRSLGFYLVADDVVGGFFAINGGGIATTGEKTIYYHAPDSLRWEATEKSYSEYLLWLFDGNLAKFYEDYRWEGWEQELEHLAGDRAFGIYPFPFCRGDPLPKRHRGQVPIQELYGLYVEDIPHQLEGLQDESQ